MGSPKGKKHRVFTQEEKVQYIEQYYLCLLLLDRCKLKNS